MQESQNYLDLVHCGMADASNLATSWVEVTPDLAGQWLAMSPGNRIISKPQVASLVVDMRAGRWRHTHQGIAFFADGSFADGHHRLIAVVESGVTCRMLVVRGLSIESGQAIDGGRPRSVQYAIAAADATGGNQWMSSQRVVAVIRMMMDEIGVGNRPATGAVIEFAKPYRHAILFALEQFPSARAGISSAPVIAAVAIVYAAKSGNRGPVQERVLMEFARVLNSGRIESPASVSVIRLRDQIMTGKMGSRGGRNRQLLCWQAQRVIAAMHDGVVLRRLAMPVASVFEITP